MKCGTLRQASRLTTKPSVSVNEAGAGLFPGDDVHLRRRSFGNEMEPGRSRAFREGLMIAAGRPRRSPRHDDAMKQS